MNVRGCGSSSSARGFIVATNREIIESAYASFANGDIPGVVAVMDPKIEWTAVSYTHLDVYKRQDSEYERVRDALDHLVAGVH